jgi:hypothetical protein
LVVAIEQVNAGQVATASISDTTASISVNPCWPRRVALSQWCKAV